MTDGNANDNQEKRSGLLTKIRIIYFVGFIIIIIPYCICVGPLEESNPVLFDF